MARRIIILAASAFFAFPSTAAVTVIGSSSARLCFEAADSPGTGVAGIEHCDRALAEEVLPAYETVATHVNRGILRLRRGNGEDAIADFDAAIARDPHQPEAYLNKGVALMRNGDSPATALPLFTTALEKKTQRPAIAYLGRGMAHELLGDLKAAYLDYQRASAADPKWHQPRAELARFTVTRRQPNS
jgi:tetratricopeptide (TPR) repeat protein